MSFGNHLYDDEDRRDRAVRRWACPTCGAARWKQCLGENKHGKDYVLVSSHTSRYLLGVKAEVVPALPGGAR